MSVNQGDLHKRMDSVSASYSNLATFFCGVETDFDLPIKRQECFQWWRDADKIDGNWRRQTGLCDIN